ncbi:hypothetical protein AB0N09_42190, partial [Streptomyces erythrochromogenes]|uniref:hypothetical protein n=1 Tax=Streptomyces erythrochromogenes TaxID=285574 RepID=UPI00343C7D19
PGVFGVLGVFGVFGVFTFLQGFLCLQGFFVVEWSESATLTEVCGAGAARAVAGSAIPPAMATEAATRIALREILNIGSLRMKVWDFRESAPLGSVSSRPRIRRKT